MTKKLTAQERYSNGVQKLHQGFVARFKVLAIIYPNLRFKHDGQHETWAVLSDMNLRFSFYTDPCPYQEEFDDELVDAGPVTYEFEIAFRFNDYVRMLHKEKHIAGQERIHLLRNHKIVKRAFKNSEECNAAWAGKVQSFVRNYVDNVSKFKQDMNTASYALKGK